MPIPKKQVRGVCDVTFRDISLTSLVGKVLCKILENRLSSMAEKSLIVEEQGGFQKKRGGRDQSLSLMLLEQTEMVRKPAGMLVAFINFAKVYEGVCVLTSVCMYEHLHNKWCTCVCYVRVCVCECVCACARVCASMDTV